MNQKFDELVRDSMTWFTDGVDVPAGLAAGARARLRRRRHVRVGLLATGTAVVAAAAVFAGTAGAGAGPGPGSGSSGSHHVAGKGGAAKRVTIQTTAVVVSRIERALTKAAAGNPVAYTQEVTQGVRLALVPPHSQPIEVNGNLTRTWSRGPLEHVEVVTSTGKLAFSSETDLRSGASVQTMISYPQRIWWRGTYQAPTATRPVVACTLGEIDRTPAQWAREVRKLLSCGAAVAGRERVDGVNTIKLKLSSTYQRACVASNDQRPCHPVPVGWTGVLWADASSYLPVRLVSHGDHYGFRIDFRWLAPNKANLAKLRQPIPAGFRRV